MRHNEFVGIGMRMTRIEKLIKRFLSKPRDFTWSELKRLLAGLDFEEVKTGKTGGSRRRVSEKMVGKYFVTLF